MTDRTTSKAWTRREALAAMTALAGGPALAGRRAAVADLPAGLAALCVAAAASPATTDLGAAAARGWTLPELVETLRTRLGPGAETDWRAALVASGQRDLGRGEVVKILGQPVLRTEANVLAIGTLVRRTG